LDILDEVSFLSFPAEIYTAFIFADKMHVITFTYLHVGMYVCMNILKYVSILNAYVK